jgi:hypothetical protein
MISTKSDGSTKSGGGRNAAEIASFLVSKTKDFDETYSEGLQVIGAGFGRTGTSSMQVALEQLYGAPCYHMREVIGKQHAGFFLDLVDKKVTDDKIREHFRAYACTQDIPTSLFWEDLLRAFPNAKVVLTVRDFEGWYKSCSETIFVTAPGNKKMWWGIWVVQHVLPPWIKWDRMMWKVRLAARCWWEDRGGVPLDPFSCVCVCIFAGLVRAPGPRRRRLLQGSFGAPFQRVEPIRHRQVSEGQVAGL